MPYEDLYRSSSFPYHVNPTASFVSENVNILSSVGFPSLIKVNDSFIAFIDALNNVNGYAAIVYPIFCSSAGGRIGVEPYSSMFANFGPDTRWQ